MSEAMRHAVVSLLHKGKNLPRDLDKNYRPISVTATEFRILGRCIHQHLATFIRHLIGETQLGFVPGCRIDENILALTELANFCDSDDSRGGIFVMLDNAKAYDIIWPSTMALPTKIVKSISILSTLPLPHRDALYRHIVITQSQWPHWSPLSHPK